MTPQQVASQIKTNLQDRKWADNASNDPVFNTNSIKVTSAIDQVALSRLSFPCALIRIGSAIADSENPALLEQQIEIVVITQVEGDAEGERILLGSNVTTGKSQGAGLLDIELEVHAVIRRMSRENGSLRIVGFHASDIEAVEVEGTGRVAARTYTVTAICVDTESTA